MRRSEHTEVVHAAGRLAVVQGAGDEVAVVDVRGGDVLRTVKLRGPVNQVALSDTGRLLVASDPQGRVTLIDLDDTASEHAMRVEALTALCAMGETFAGTDIRAQLMTLDIPRRMTQARRSLATPADRVTALSGSSRAGIMVAGRASGALDVVEADTFAPLLRIDAAPSLTHGCVFDRGRHVVIVPGFRSVAISEGGNRAALIDVGSGTRVEPPVHRHPVTGAARVGEHGALTVDQGGGAAVWHGAAGQLLKPMGDDSFTACAEWQAGGIGVAGTQDERVVLFGRRPRAARFHANTLAFRAGISAIAATGRPLRLFATYYNGLVRFRGPRARWTGRKDTRHSLRGTAVALDAGARLAASGNLNGEVQLWRCADGQLLSDLSLHEAEVTALAFSPSGARLYSAGADGLIYVVDTRGLRVEDGTALSSPAIALQVAEDDALYAILGNGNVTRIPAPLELVENPG